MSQQTPIETISLLIDTIPDGSIQLGHMYTYRIGKLYFTLSSLLGSEAKDDYIERAILNLEKVFNELGETEMKRGWKKRFRESLLNLKRSLEYKERPRENEFVHEE